MDYADFVLRQRSGFTSEFKNQMSVCLMATTPERLRRHADEYGWTVGYLEGVRPTSAIVVQKSGGDPELWARRDYGGYRRAFAVFLRQYYGFGSDAIPRAWQVDHLQSTFRFKKSHPDYFIRLCLLERDVNSSYGAGFEKLFCRQEREKIPSGGIHVDWISFLKMSGCRLPKKSLGQREWSLWAWQLAHDCCQQGIEDKLLAYAGISTVLNLGFTGQYSPLPFHENFREEALASPTISCLPELSGAPALQLWT